VVRKSYGVSAPSIPDYRAVVGDSATVIQEVGAGPEKPRLWSYPQYPNLKNSKKLARWHPPSRGSRLYPKRCSAHWDDALLFSYRWQNHYGLDFAQYVTQSKDRHWQGPTADNLKKPVAT